MLLYSHKHSKHSSNECGILLKELFVNIYIAFYWIDFIPRFIFEGWCLLLIDSIHRFLLLMLQRTEIFISTFWRIRILKIRTICQSVYMVFLLKWKKSNFLSENYYPINNLNQQTNIPIIPLIFVWLQIVFVWASRLGCPFFTTKRKLAVTISKKSWKE